MRSPVLIAATAITVGWLGACSKPVADARASALGPQDSRQIRLVEEPRLDSAVASDLEAGRHSHASPLVRRVRKPDLAAVASAAPAPAMRVTAHTEHALDLAPAPAAPAPASVEVPAEAEQPAAFQRSGTGWHGMGSDQPEHLSRPGGMNGGPQIIIRGGMGGDGDKCDLRPRGFRGGSSVNRLAPPMGGYGGGLTPFPRGNR